MWCPRAMVKYKSAARNWNWNEKKKRSKPQLCCYNGLCNACTPCRVDIRSICARLRRPEAQRAAFWAEIYMGTVPALSSFSLISLSKCELHFCREHFFRRFYIQWWTCFCCSIIIINNSNSIKSVVSITSKNEKSCTLWFILIRAPSGYR
jgi:L-lactate utilization protein LutB